MIKYIYGILKVYYNVMYRIFFVRLILLGPGANCPKGIFFYLKGPKDGPGVLDLLIGTVLLFEGIYYLPGGRVIREGWSGRPIGRSVGRIYGIELGGWMRRREKEDRWKSTQNAFYTGFRGVWEKRCLRSSSLLIFFFIYFP